MTAPTPASRPRPLLSAATVNSWKSGLGTLVTLAASLGAVTATQAGAINDAIGIVLAAVSAVAAAVGSITHVVGLVRQGEKHVTPIADPRGRDGASLTTAVLDDEVVGSHARRDQ